MLAFLIFLFVALCAYGAYRAIRGGFERPQSERWTPYSIVTAVVVVMLVIGLVNRILE